MTLDIQELSTTMMTRKQIQELRGIVETEIAKEPENSERCGDLKAIVSVLSNAHGSGSKKDHGERWALIVFAIFTALSLLGLWVWGHYFVDAWAGKSRRSDETAQSGDERNYSVPGTYGDAFAPIVGVMTALALGATVASAYMQQREMKQAREQFTAQAAALEDANRHAAEANVRAAEDTRFQVLASLLDSLRLTGEIDTEAVRLIQQDFGSGDPMGDWLLFVQALERREKLNFDTTRLRYLASQRRVVQKVLHKLRVDAGVGTNPWIDRPGTPPTE